MELKINNSYVNLEENVRGMRTKSANNHSLIPTTFFIIIAHCVLKSIYYLLLFAELCAFHCSLEAEFQLSFVLIITSGMFFLSLSFHALVHIGIHFKQTHIQNFHMLPLGDSSVFHCASCTAHKNDSIRQISGSSIVV